MKVLRNRIERTTASGEVQLLPEDPEDMWHAYNLIRKGDLVTASTIRRVVAESNTGATSSSRVTTKLAVQVSKTDFDSTSSHMRVSGPVAVQNSYVSVGDFHTVDLELNRAFTLTKDEGGWDLIALETLLAATDATGRADLWVVMMREGLANICLVTEYRTVLQQRVDIPLPKKRGAIGSDNAHAKALDRFHKTVLTTVLRQMKLDQTFGPGRQAAPLVVASPGFTASNFVRYMRETAETAATTAAGGANDLGVASKVLRQFMPMVHAAHANNASMSSIPALLSSPELAKALEQSKSGRDAVFLDKFHKQLLADDDKAWYGRMAVLHAYADGLIGHACTVLLADHLFRAADNADRRRWVGFVDSVRKAGAECRIVSSAHQVGARLDALGGVVVLLAVPAPHLNEDTFDGTEDGYWAGDNTAKRAGT